MLHSRNCTSKDSMLTPNYCSCLYPLAHGFKLCRNVKVRLNSYQLKQPLINYDYAKELNKQVIIMHVQLYKQVIVFYIYTIITLNLRKF